MSQPGLWAGFWFKEGRTGNVYSALSHLVISASVIHSSHCYPLALLPLLEEGIILAWHSGQDTPCKPQSVFSFTFNAASPE